MVIENTKKTRKVIITGMFQKISNWQARPARIKETVVMELKTMATMNQLIQ